MLRPSRISPLAFAVALSLACSSAPSEEAPAARPETAAATHASIDLDDPTVCGSCHAAVTEEWRSSMHSQAHHERDPLYAAMRTLRMGREGEALAIRCAGCHGPRDPQDPNSAAARQGVSCATCHNLRAVEAGQRGAAALRWAEDGALRGPHDASAQSAAPHPTGAAAPWLTDGQTLCLSCHGQMANAAGAPTCTTGTEFAEGAGDQTCTGCHMPTVEGPSGAVSQRATHRSHRFHGPHDLLSGDQTFMRGAVALEAAFDGDALVATLDNDARHAVPSGFPGRMVLVRVRGWNGAGELVYRNFVENPLSEDPDAVLHRAYVDAEGQPTLPPYAARVARDTRLRPDETRTLRWTLPAGVTRAEVALLYRFVPPPAAQRLGVAGTPVGAAHPFAEATTTR